MRYRREPNFARHTGFSPKDHLVFTRASHSWVEAGVGLAPQCAVHRSSTAAPVEPRAGDGVPGGPTGGAATAGAATDGPGAGGSGAGRLRVLVLIKCLGRGGAERLVVDMARHRDPARVDVEVAYVLDGYDALVPELAAAGVPVHALGARGNGDPTWMVRLRALLRGRRFDVVHTHLPYAATLGRLVVASLPPGRRPAVVSTEHCMWNEVTAPLRALNRLTIGRDDAVLAVSDAARRALPPRQRRRALVVVHGTDLAAVRAIAARAPAVRAAVRRELGVADDEVLALTVANYRPQKAYDVLLDAAAGVVRRHRTIRFAAAGWGPLEAEVVERHRALGLGRRFLLLGQRTDVLRLLAAADLFVLSSRYEGLPVALMEATALGVPPVVTAVGELPRVLTDGHDAVLVPPGRPDLLADAVTRVAGDPMLRRRLSVAASTLGARFDVAAATRRVEAVYEAVTAGRPAAVAAQSGDDAGVAAP